MTKSVASAYIFHSYCLMSVSRGKVKIINDDINR